MELGEKIAALRKSQNMTQSELGVKLNVTFQAVSKWERGESYPDFETLSKIAKICGVSISYFEDHDESESEADSDATDDADAAATADALEQDKKVIGFCKECGKIVHENEEACTTPAIICKQCVARKAALKREQEKRAAEAKRNKQRAVQYQCLTKRNRGLIAAGVIVGALMVLMIALSISSFSWNYLIGAIFLTVFGYTFVAQLFWGGIIVDVCLFGGKIVGMPGVIFSLDLDGFIFLIAVKILFALIKLFIFLLTLFFAVFIAYIISPFTFVPQLLKLNRGEEL